MSSGGETTEDSSSTQVTHLTHSPGTQPDYVYDSSMAWWRAGIRRFLVQNLKAESRWIAAMQKCIRNPWLDTYFVYTSSLGTHTFFMTILPALFFFGYAKTGRGIVNVLALGVYFSSLVKDLICSPRPFAPPVTRLVMGSHHLEYGFPSTHTTNSISMALYLYTILRQYRPSLAANTDFTVVSPITYSLTCGILIIYAVSIVFGRLYCAMHSFSDCIMGVALGTAIWAAQVVFGDVFDDWLMTKSWIVPFVIISLGLFMVHQHAEPVDDCPCFEDAIAFIAVVIGVSIGHWHEETYSLSATSGFFKSRTPGWDTPFSLSSLGFYVWLSFASLKMIVGVMIIFGWRILAKWVMHTVLPPLFRLLATLVELPRRRFYTPATDYKGSVPEEGVGLFYPIPSVIDIPGMIHGDGVEVVATGANLLPRYSEGGIALRGGGGGGGGGSSRSGTAAVGKGNGGTHTNTNSGGQRTMVREEKEDEDKVAKKHYDADVLTKVVVYAGIGWGVSEFIPVMFELLG
ncbi:phosphatidic acid phosphatase type 2/haloperoxidase [Cantharellus anzutake]|uniref:phosphatidic acid phosphatase type 2/haloperoxidase n=1 Tax=Cantharellus anzutake TaxID=1750568 RepID=UPI0019071961|nr:phosphatidic acid phosphatase type 2/haloperoxidase [Cantharellus anzutake]KAF8325770.1 phosphatidic acid phosphatase type 2/haloperoxidase [Cantharellus anzutake]